MKSLRPPLALLLAAGVVLAGWASGLFSAWAGTIKAWVLSMLEHIERLDPWLAALSFVLLYIAATVLFVPGLLVTMAAGALFGVMWGTALVSLASVCGASLAFLVGRYLARDWVARKLEKRDRFRAVDDAIARDGGTIVLLLRLSPLFPYNLLNYALGITRVRFRSYVLASWIGMLPGTVLYVYLGSVAGSLASLAVDSGATRTPMQWLLFAVGLVATAVVTVLITRLARRSLATRLEAAS